VTNKRRRERATTAAMARPHITREQQIETVRTYLRCGNTNRAADELGITGSAFRDRLFALRCPLRPQGFSYRSSQWEAEVMAVLRRLRDG
jgi:hypothetical protein